MGIGLAALAICIFGGCSNSATEPPVTASSTVLATVPADWRKFSSQQGKFALLMPGVPKEKKTPIDTDLGPIQEHRFTVIVQGFGIGLMDQSYATVRNCLFDAIRKPTIVRTYSDYAISYSNISFSGNTPRYDDDLQNHDISLLRRPPYPPPGTFPALSLKDVPKYDSVGLTFIQQQHFKSHDIDEYRKHLPKFAANAGSPEASDENADGTRNTLGAFGGPFGNWWK